MAMQTINSLSSRISNLWIEEKFQSLSDEARDAIGLVDEIRSLGAELYVELPTVVFIGKQSAGKSSLVEALTKITLPRQDGTCTRSVTEVLTKNAPTFSCSVVLKWHRQGGSVHTEAFEELPDLASVEDCVRRAQLVLLNPRHHFDQSKDDKLLYDANRRASQNELKFTRDAVCVRIRGPTVGNVSLIDLPGLIQYTEEEKDQKYIKLVEALVVEYIRRPQSIIVSIISCKDDIENQSVKALASKYDKAGKRTIGVLTKPDAIEAGCHETWLDILTNKSHTLKLGWYIVKNPSKKALEAKPTFEESRREELRYFAETHPWSEIADPDVRSQIGCAALLQALGKLLQFKIVEQLPKIRSTVTQRLEKSSVRLEAMPKELKADLVKITLHNMIDSFAEDLRKVIGSENSTIESQPREFWHSIVSEMEQFRVRLAKTQPQFSLLQGRDEYQREECKEFGPIRSLEEVQNILIPQTLGRKLPVTGYGALTSLLQEFVDQWEAPALRFVQRTAAKLSNMTTEVVARKFNEFPRVHEIVAKELQKEIIHLERKALDRVKHVVELERIPSTIHKPKLNEYTENYMQKLHSAMYPDEAAAINQEQLKKLVESASNRSTRLTNIDDLVNKLQRVRGNIARKPTPMVEQALHVIADTCAYWKVAYFRFSDYVPKEVDKELLCCFSDGCRSLLMERLNILQGKSSDLMHLLEEDPNVAKVRSQLSDEVARLTKISEKLNKFV